MKLAVTTLLMMLASLASTAFAASMRPGLRNLLQDVEKSNTTISSLAKYAATPLYQGGTCIVYADAGVTCASAGSYTYPGCCTSADKYGYCNTYTTGPAKCSGSFQYVACCKYPAHPVAQCQKPRQIDSLNRNCYSYSGYTIDSCALPGATTAYPQANPIDDCPTGTNWWCCPSS